MAGMVLVALALDPFDAQALEGFGANTPGGAGGSVYYVTSLADSGPGTLRAAVAQGGRTVEFAVAGTIVLQSKLTITADFLTIDGFSAPSPGITIRGYGLILREAHDVIIRGIRVRDAAVDGISVQYGSWNIFIHNVSIQGSGDGNLDITGNPSDPSTTVHDVTVAWSILAQPAGVQKNVLVKYNPSQITLHHNLFVAAQQRNPQVRIDDVGTPAQETTADIRNNLVWNWPGGYGTLVYYGPWANIVGNYYASPDTPPSTQAKAIQVSNGARAFVAGNVSGDGVNVNVAGTESSPFPAPAVTTQDACRAAQMILGQVAGVEGAGVQPLDVTDLSYVQGIALVGCDGLPSPPPPSPPPPTPLPSAPDLRVESLVVPRLNNGNRTLTIEPTVRNIGDASAGASIVSVYLGTSSSSLNGAVPLGTGGVTALAPGQGDAVPLTVTIPAGVSGRYYLFVVADANGAVAESNESNNQRVQRLTVR